MIALAWIIFGGVLLATILFCYAIVKYYQDKNEAQFLPNLVTVIGLATTLFCVLLIPVDIYSVSSTSDTSGNKLLSPDEIQVRSDAVRILYYVFYATILALAFGIIPFTYFYYEEQDDETSFGQRVWAGCKYTIFLIIIVAIMLVIGLVLYFVKPGDKPTSTANTKDWAAHLLEQENFAEAAISFAIACLSIIGYVSWIIYTAYGLSALPIGLIKGRKHLTEEVSSVKSGIDAARSESNTIKSKYLGGKQMSKRDEEKLDLLSRKERVLSRQGQRLESSNTGWRKVWSAMKPFFFIFGIIFLLFSLFVVLSVILTDIDKAVHSTNFCGSSCGFVLAYPTIFNPVDSLLTLLSKYFPLDYVVVALIVLYIFFATLSGITRIGIRFLWVYMYKVRARSTPPQGLLMTAVILMLAILALNMEVTTLAPQYASFGSQMWLNTTSGELEKCSMNAPPGNCTMSQIGTFVNRISVRTSFFGIVFYFASWLFIALYLVGIVIAVVKGKATNVEGRESDSDEDE